VNRRHGTADGGHGSNREATEQLAARSGPGVAGLLNVTFGNAHESIIIKFIAPVGGMHEVVNASLVGARMP
jgi:Ca2+:H+ antiporter